MAEQDLITKYRKASDDSNIVDEEWYCDIYSLLYELIHEYNASLNYDPGPAFRNTQKIIEALPSKILSNVTEIAGKVAWQNLRSFVNKMNVEIIPLEGTTEEVITAMMNGHTAEPRDVVTIDDGFKITYEGSTIQKGISSDVFKEIIEFTLGIGANIALSTVSSFIYDILKGKVQKLWINSHEVSVDKDKIQKALEAKPEVLEEKPKE